MADFRRVSVADSQSRISFEQESGHRFLTIDGMRSFHVDFDCSTCDYWFARVSRDAWYRSPTSISNALRAGLEAMDDELIEAIQPILPAGDYLAVLSRIKPYLVAPGSEGDYFTRQATDTFGTERDPCIDYYRGRMFRFAPGDGTETAALFEFIVPLYSPQNTNAERLSEYTSELLSGARPTALALSTFGVYAPVRGDEDYEHWCLTHYLLDGHHKVRAAAETHRGITLLSFVETRNPLIERLVELLSDRR